MHANAMPTAYLVILSVDKPTGLEKVHVLWELKQLMNTLSNSWLATGGLIREMFGLG